MTPLVRRAVQAVLYEVIAIVAVGPAMALWFERPIGSSLLLASSMSAGGVAWNFVVNHFFGRWEARQSVSGRSWKRRLADGIGFEGGLVLMLVPLMAWWLNTSLLAAFVADLGILAFFFVYAIVFTWGFDRVFGLPASARGGTA